MLQKKNNMIKHDKFSWYFDKSFRLLLQEIYEKM